MLLITVATVLAGVMVYIQSGNHVYIESSDQFNRAADILYNTVFTIRGHRLTWMIPAIMPL